MCAVSVLIAGDHELPNLKPVTMPETVDPEAGASMRTAGGVISPHGITV
jgi:hypothetical protein